MRLHFSIRHGDPRHLHREKDTLWEESKRLVNPHEVYVDLSDKLYHIKSDLLEEMSMKALDEQ